MASVARRNLIEQRVALARKGENPYVICRLVSGWLVIGDVQPVAGYCLLLADPVVDSLNALADAERTQYCLDMARIGDALIAVTGATRINYETLGNIEPALHTHITPRYASEPAWRRRMAPTWVRALTFARRFDPQQDGDLMQRLRQALT